MTIAKELEEECVACSGTGLYVGFTEAKGEAVVCLRCQGSGSVIHKHVPFAGRKKRRGITIIRVSAGTFVATGVGGTGKSMTYKDFESAYPNTSVRRRGRDG